MEFTYAPALPEGYTVGIEPTCSCLIIQIVIAVCSRVMCTVFYNHGNYKCLAGVDLKNR